MSTFSPPGYHQVPGGSSTDPMHWRVAEVIHAFCHPRGQLRASFSGNDAGISIIEHALRENDIDGETLLTQIHQDTLKNDLGIQSFGLRRKVWALISNLRKSSASFQALSDSRLRDSGAPSNTTLQLNSSTESGPRSWTTSATPSVNVNPTQSQVPPKIRASGPTSDGNEARRGEHLVVDAAGNKRRRLNLEPRSAFYLDHTACPLEKVFYGSTPLNGKVELGVEGFDEEYEELQSFSWSTVGPQSTVTYMEQINRPQAGQSIAVNSLLKAFFLNNDLRAPKYYRNNSIYAAGIEPISTNNRNRSDRKQSRYLRKPLRGAEALVTIFSNNGQDIVPIKCTRQHWDYVPEHNKAQHRAWLKAVGRDIEKLVHSNDIRTQPVQQTARITEINSMPGPTTSANDWDTFVKKYTLLDAVDQEVLPTYGDSGSEGEYDDQTWDEIEAERAKDSKSTSSNELPVELVQDLISEAKSEILSQWTAKKLPTLEARAWKIWSTFHALGNVLYETQSLVKQKSRMQERLLKLEKNIREAVWVQPIEVKTQCQSLYYTVFDIATADWKLKLVKQPEAPPQPSQPVDKIAKPDKPLATVMLATDEEEISDSATDSDGFMDNRPSSDPASAALQMERANCDSPMETHDNKRVPVSRSESERSRQDPVEQVTKAISSKKTAVFRLPPQVASGILRPTPPEVIYISSSENEDTTYLGMSLTQLRAVPWEDMNANGTPEAKLAWIIAKQTFNKGDMLSLLNERESTMRRCIHLAYVSMLDGTYDKIENLPGRLAYKHESVFTIASWFLAWFKGAFWRETPLHGPLGIPRALVEEMVSHWDPEMGNYKKFVGLIRERFFLERLEQAVKNRSTPERPHQSVTGHFKGYKSSRLVAGQDMQSLDREKQLVAMSRREFLHRALRKLRTENVVADAIVNIECGNDVDAIRVNPHIARRMKSHQLDGVRFIWKEVVVPTTASGCLLAHPMGMGKTMQVIAFLLTLTESAHSETAGIKNQIPDRFENPCTLILAPPSLVENWYDELLKWLPQDARIPVDAIHKVTSSLSVPERISIVQAWHDHGGILVSSTSFFKRAMCTSDDAYKDTAETLGKRANIVVLDEAQESKNMKSLLREALQKVETRARIAITGSPLSNNLLEYFVLIDFVAQGYLGSMTDFRSRYYKPITQGLYKDAPKNKQRLGLQLQKVLTKFLEAKVHRADISELHHQLHGKTEFIIRVELTPIQLRCYKLLVNGAQAGESTDEAEEMDMATLWAFLSMLKLLCNHPRCFHDRIESQPQKATTNVQPQEVNNLPGYDSGLEEIERESQRLANDPTNLLEGNIRRRQLQILKQPESLDTLSLSNKMVMLFKIVDLCIANSEKVLVFSHSIPTLDFIQLHLGLRNVAMMRIDGAQKVDLRQAQTKQFNEDDSITVGIVSTRAGGTGLNLYGASRVVIMDDWFNPMFEQQAIGRAYRIGQTKHVYVYRLVAAGSFEEEMQNQGVFKTGLANRIVDKKDTVRAASMSAGVWLRAPSQLEHEDWADATSRDPNVLDQITADADMRASIQSIKLGESYFVDEKEELTAEEQAMVDSIIQDEQLRRTDPEAYFRQRIAKRFADLTNTSSPVRPSGQAPATQSNSQSTVRPLGSGLSPSFPPGSQTPLWHIACSNFYFAQRFRDESRSFPVDAVPEWWHQLALPMVLNLSNMNTWHQSHPEWTVEAVESLLRPTTAPDVKFLVLKVLFPERSFPGYGEPYPTMSFAPHHATPSPSVFPQSRPMQQLRPPNSLHMQTLPRMGHFHPVPTRMAPGRLSTFPPAEVGQPASFQSFGAGPVDAQAGISAPFRLFDAGFADAEGPDAELTAAEVTDAEATDIESAAKEAAANRAADDAGHDIRFPETEAANTEAADAEIADADTSDVTRHQHQSHNSEYFAGDGTSDSSDRFAATSPTSETRLGRRPATKPRRTLILPGSARTRPVGSHGVDVAATVAATRAATPRNMLSTATERVAHRPLSSPPKALVDAAVRSRARTDLAMQIRHRHAPPHKTARQPEREAYENRIRAEAQQAERRIFATASTEAEYHALLAAEARPFATAAPASPRNERTRLHTRATLMNQLSARCARIGPAGSGLLPQLPPLKQLERLARHYEKAAHRATRSDDAAAYAARLELPSDRVLVANLAAFASHDTARASTSVSPGASSVRSSQGMARPRK